MSSVKDIDPNYRVDWYRVPLAKEVLEDLNTRSDGKGFLQAGGYLLSIVMTGTLLAYTLTHLTWGWWIPALILHGTVSSFTINAVHELVHGTVFQTRKLNELFSWIFGIYGMWNSPAFWASHSEHHKFTLHDPEDSEVVVPLTHDLKGFLQRSTIELGAVKWLFESNIRLACGIPISEWGEHLYGTKELRFRIFNFSRVVLGVHLAILLLSVAMGWWWLPIVTTLHIAYAKGLHFLLNETQHIGLQDHVNDFRLNSRTFYCNPVFRFLYWHMNYHIEHHMYAGVPCYNLHKLHKAIQSELPYTFNGMAETWFHIITCIYRQKHEPGYVYVPVIPGGEQAEEVGRTAVQRDRSTPAVSKAVMPVANTAPPDRPYKTWECTVCGFIYDGLLGLPEEGIAPGTRWEDIPDDWRCPDCGVAKADFTMKEIDRPADASRIPSTVDVGSTEPIVLVGSGLAVYQTVKAFRKLNSRKEIVVVTRDDGGSYYKPSLSNALAQGKTADTLLQASAAELEKELGIRILTHQTVEKLDRETKTLYLRNGERLSYSRLVLGLGAEPMALPFEGVFRINDRQQYAEFRAALPEQGHVAIIGAGLVGCEFANDLVENGYRVTVLDLADRPLASFASEADSEGLRSALQAKGVSWLLGRQVTRVAEGTTLETAQGDVVQADVVLSAIGLSPRIQIASDAGLICSRGIQVDAFLRTSDTDVFALGDCAEIEGRWYPFVEPLVQSARALAQTLAGTDTPVSFTECTVSVKTPAYPLTLRFPANEQAKQAVASPQEL